MLDSLYDLSYLSTDQGCSEYICILQWRKTQLRESKWCAQAHTGGRVRTWVARPTLISPLPYSLFYQWALLCKEWPTTSFTHATDGHRRTASHCENRASISSLLSTKPFPEPNEPHRPISLLVTFTILFCKKLSCLQAFSHTDPLPEFPTFFSPLIHSIQHIFIELLLYARHHATC